MFQWRWTFFVNTKSRFVKYYLYKEPRFLHVSSKRGPLQNQTPNTHRLGSFCIYQLRWRLTHKNTAHSQILLNKTNKSHVTGFCLWSWMNEAKVIPFRRWVRLLCVNVNSTWRIITCRNGMFWYTCLWGQHKTPLLEHVKLLRQV